jgi:glutathione reductase (NADPH)
MLGMSCSDLSSWGCCIPSNGFCVTKPDTDSEAARCVPKKMTWNFASINEALHAAKHYGYDVPTDVKIDYGHFKRIRDATIERLNGNYERNWNKEGIDLVHGRARFVEPKTLEVTFNDGSGKARYTAKHILIATGGHPLLPNVKGAEHGITSDGFFEIEELPRKWAVVGAGYIAVELAGVLAAVGVETHMFIRGENLLRKFDPMIQETMTERYEATGIHIHRNHKGFEEIQLLKDGKGADKLLKLIGKDGEEYEVNELLWAIGRAPEVEDLGLDVAGVKRTRTGHIVVDDFQNTSVEGIYALGDVTGQAELTPGKLFLLPRFLLLVILTRYSGHCGRSPVGQSPFWTSRTQIIQAVVREHPDGGLLPSGGGHGRSDRTTGAAEVWR